MFSSPSATTNQSRSVASRALKGAGLTGNDEDVRMNDAGGGPQRTARNRPHERPQRSKRLDKLEQDASSSAKQTTTLASRLRNGAGSTISIRGAAPTSGPSLAARLGGTAAARGARVRNVIREPPSGNSRIPRAVGIAASVDILRQVVTSRWDPQTQFLNLERLAEDDIMRKHKIPSLEARDAPRQLGPVIFKLAKELIPPCKTVSLANNNLVSTHNLSSLNHYLPNLNALSLENNKLSSMRDLDGISLKSAKNSLCSIAELVLKGNPLRERALAEGKIESFKSDILRRFTMLAVLDGETIPRLGFDVDATTVNQASTSATKSTVNPLPDTFPLHMEPNLFLGGVDQVSAQFLTQYFTLFDTARPSLSVAYAPHATFSISANTSIPPRARRRGLHNSADLPNQKALNWAFYHSQSRNLERLLAPLAPSAAAKGDKAVELLRSGPEAIMRSLEQLPPTTHTLTEPGKFVVDAFPMEGMLHGGEYGTDALVINVHGEFSEGPSWGVRSFDRSFVLALAPPGSPAQLAGWSCVILSDMFTVRCFSSPDAWTPGPLTTTAVTYNHNAQPRPRIENKGSQSQLPPNSLQRLQMDPILATVPDYQKSLLIQLSQQTGLTIQYSGQCLEGNGWNMQLALANFQAVKATLPEEAWLR